MIDTAFQFIGLIVLIIAVTAAEAPVGVVRPRVGVGRGPDGWPLGAAALGVALYTLFHPGFVKMNGCRDIRPNQPGPEFRVILEWLAKKQA